MGQENKLVAAGIDWVTITTDQKPVAEKWYQQVHDILFRGEILRAETKTRRIQGYVGEQGDGCFIGDREDGWMLIFSSDVARERAHAAMAAGGRTSRLDLQITLKMADGPDQALFDAWHAACGHKYAGGRMPRLRAEIEPQRLIQVKIGSRTSEYYGRCYNKQLESGEERYEGCVRWEVEIKGHAAHSIGEKLAARPVGYLESLDTVYGWWRAHGVTVPYQLGQVEPLIADRRKPTTLERKRAWLVSSVAPSVGIVAQEVGILQALRDVTHQALDDDALVCIIDEAAKMLGG